MFRKTLIRLTLINSLVFIVLISILGSIVYIYTENKLYKDVNESLENTVRFVQKESQPVPLTNDLTLEKKPRFMIRDPRMMTLLWGQNQLLLADQRYEFDLFKDNEKLLRPKQLNTLQDVKIENYTFRYMAIEVDHPELGKITVQFLRNINSEKDFLDRLLVIMLIGCGIAMVCAIGFSYFLAGRALVPIKHAWQKQQEFVSDASHELRTPLAVIQAKTDLLFRNPTSTIQDRIIDISTISNESRRLSKLVAKLLTLARYDSDQIEMQKETFQLDELLTEIVQQFEDIVLYQEKAIHLQTEQSVSFCGDRGRIHQLLVILLDNALKYTDEGGEIFLSCHQTLTSIILQVKDNGIGIPEEDIPRIFDRFFQSDKARTKTDGAGLGLSIAKWIIDKHSGKTKVHSKVGQGTTIEISFPKVQNS